MAVLCILLLHVKWSHLLALQITEHIQRLRRHERIWNCCHFSHLPSLLSPSSSSTLELILRFLLSEASLPKGFLSVQSKKHGGASKSERMLVLSLKEALKKAKLVRLSSLYSEIPEQNKAPHLCLCLGCLQHTSPHHALSSYPCSRTVLSQRMEQSVSGSASSRGTPFQMTPFITEV